MSYLFTDEEPDFDSKPADESLYPEACPICGWQPRPETCYLDIAWDIHFDVAHPTL